MISFRYASCDDQGRTQVTCPDCGGKTVMRLDPDRFHAWVNGKLIQHAFPDLNPTQRETLITGLCDSCQDELYGLPEED